MIWLIVCCVFVLLVLWMGVLTWLEHDMERRFLALRDYVWNALDDGTKDNAEED